MGVSVARSFDFHRKKHYEYFPRRVRILPPARPFPDFWLRETSLCGAGGNIRWHSRDDVAEEFKAAGLNKLSPEELQKLDAWLQGYRQVAEKKATARAERTKLDLLVSRVAGNFGGLTGRTVISLEDGTVWKQANPDDRFRPRVTDHPAAVVLHGIFGYKMRIEGTPEFYVDPVRNR